MQERKLEIGPHSSGKINPSWETMDMIKKPFVDIVHNVRKLPLPIKNDTYKLIYMSHILEHVPWFQTTDLLKELRRVLVRGGLLEIWVPDLEKLVKAYLNPELVKKDGWYKHNPEKDPVKWFNGRLFTYGPGEENWHRATFDAPYLLKCLRDAGFRNTKKLDKPRGTNYHGWINLGASGQK